MTFLVSDIYTNIVEYNIDFYLNNRKYIYTTNKPKFYLKIVIDSIKLKI